MSVISEIITEVLPCNISCISQYVASSAENQQTILDTNETFLPSESWVPWLEHHQRQFPLQTSTSGLKLPKLNEIRGSHHNEKWHFNSKILRKHGLCESYSMFWLEQLCIYCAYKSLYNFFFFFFPQPQTKFHWPVGGVRGRYFQTVDK